MEDYLNIMKWITTSIFLNGRRPQFFFKWKTTSIFLKMEDDLIFYLFFQKKDDLNILKNGRRAQKNNIYI